MLFTPEQGSEPKKAKILGLQPPLTTNNKQLSFQFYMPPVKKHNLTCYLSGMLITQIWNKV